MVEVLEFIFESSTHFFGVVVLMLIAGAMVVMWLREFIMWSPIRYSSITITGSGPEVADAMERATKAARQ